MSNILGLASPKDDLQIKRENAAAAVAGLSTPRSTAREATITEQDSSEPEISPSGDLSLSPTLPNTLSVAALQAEDRKPKWIRKAKKLD